MRRYHHLYPSVLGSVVFLLISAPSFAAKTVFVEGNCGDPSVHSVQPRSCGDYDGDGRIGTAEDADGDVVFGTINAALGRGGINQDGIVTIVTSGLFQEALRIEGRVELEAAPGVAAQVHGGGLSHHIDCLDCTLRNLHLRSNVTAVEVFGRPNQRAHVTFHNCQADNSGGDGFRVCGHATATYHQCSASGNQGHGIVFCGNASGIVIGTTLTGNQGDGMRVSDHASATAHQCGSSWNRGNGITFCGSASGNAHGTSLTGNHGDGMRVSDHASATAHQCGSSWNRGNGFTFSEDAAGMVSETAVHGNLGVGVANEGQNRVCVSRVTASCNRENFERVHKSDGDCECRR